MANRSTASVLGLCTTLLTLIDENTQELTAAGLDVSKVRTPIEQKQKSLALHNNEQEALKRALVAKTAQINNESEDTYTTVSSAIDAVRGVIGHKTPLGKQVTALRTEINRKRTPKAPATPPV